MSSNPPNKVEFAVELPRTRQEYEALLWVEGKGAMAGSMTMLDRPFGFFALREGGTFAPDGEDVGPMPEKVAPPGRLTVRIKSDGVYSLDGKDLDESEFAATCKEAVAREPATSILFRIPADLPFAGAYRAIEAARAGGVCHHSHRARRCDQSEGIVPSSAHSGALIVGSAIADHPAS